MKKLLLIAVLLGAAYFGLIDSSWLSTENNQTGVNFEKVSETVLEHAIAGKKGNLQVEGYGTVTRILPDDNKGSRHQRFIITISSGKTLLISHNIDLAPRIDSLKTGDTLEFYGEYEWNPQGGVIHWTHHDPAGRHTPGWIIHKGKRYD